MSAYGTIATPTRAPVTLASRIYSLPASSNQILTVFHLTRATCPSALTGYLARVFNEVIEEGRTYPQEMMLSLEEFENYFLGGDCFVGIISDISKDNPEAACVEGTSVETPISIDSVKRDCSWEECVGGMFYVKPNYPGRSNHNCNGGFVVPPIQRGLKLGRTLGRAYLHFAPLLGYKASVFNLVYVSNVASTKIWDSLGFNAVGLVPNAGRLKSKVPGGEDEWCDAIVYHKTF